MKEQNIFREENAGNILREIKGMNTNKHTNNKSTGALKIIGWVVAVFFWFLALAAIVQGGFLSGVLFVAFGVIISPIGASLLQKTNINNRLKKPVRVLVAVILFIAGALAIPRSYNESSELTSNTDTTEQIIADTVSESLNSGNTAPESEETTSYASIQTDTASATTQETTSGAESSMTAQTQTAESAQASAESTTLTDNIQTTAGEASVATESASVTNTQTATDNTQATSEQGAVSGGNSVIVPTTEDTEGNLVWVPTQGGEEYHSKSTCSGMENPMQITLEKAIASNYEPCQRCYGQ